MTEKKEHFIHINWTCGSMDEARKVARYLVQERLVACAQITPWIESVFMWNNELETVQETKVVFKTIFENYDAIKEVIERNCKYEVPEIIWSSIDGGNKSYMEWLDESTKITSA